MVPLTRLALTLLLLAVGCATTSNLNDEVREHAAARFECPLEQTSAREETNGRVRNPTYVAEGCGQRIRLECTEGVDNQLVCPENAPIEGKDPNPVTIGKSDPPASCKDLGPIQTVARHSSYDALFRKFKIEIRSRGGNYGRLDGQQGSILRGVAFDCPRSATASAPPDRSPPAAP